VEHHSVTADLNVVLVQVRTGEIVGTIAVREFDEVQANIWERSHVSPEVGGKTTACTPL
jgi:hypothetical protein